MNIKVKTESAIYLGKQRRLTSECDQTPVWQMHSRWPMASEIHGTDHVNLAGKGMSDPARCLTPDGTEPRNGAEKGMGM